MLEKLPLQSYSWVNDMSTFAKNFVVNYKDDDYGYILEVHVEYPKKLHDIHFDLPFLCVPDTVFKTKKLQCTLEDKYRYIVHIKMLKLTLQNGLKLLNVHRAAKFYQFAWLKPNIDFNTKLRIKSDKRGDSFGVSFYKLMINSVFSWTMENKRKYRDIRLIKNTKTLRKQSSQQNYYDSNHFSENLITLEMCKTKVFMNKLTAIGFSILEFRQKYVIAYECRQSNNTNNLQKHLCRYE